MKSFVVVLLGISLLPLSTLCEAAAGSRSPEMPKVLQIYAEATHKTVLFPSALAGFPAPPLSNLPTNSANVAAFVENELARLGLAVVPDGSLFVRVTPGDWTNAPLTTALASLQSLRNSRSLTGDTSRVAAGMVDLMGADLDSVLPLYSELRNRTLLRPLSLPSATIHLRNQSALTRDDIVYAMSVVLALNGIGIVDDGDKLAQAVPLAEVSQVKARAPRTESGLPRIEPREVPKFRQTLSLPGPQPTPELRRIPGSDQESPSYASRPTVDGLVEFYAQRAGRKFAPSTTVGGAPILFEVRTPLTQPQLLYAIETTLALNRIAIVAGDGDTVHAEPISVRER